MSEITITGNAADGPELSYIQSGVAVATFRIARNDGYRDRSGEWVSSGDTLFVLPWDIFREPPSCGSSSGHVTYTADGTRPRLQGVGRQFGA
jgi:Single-strand binding protein family